MRLIDFKATSSSLVGTLELHGRTERLYYEFEGASPAESADPFLVAMLLPAMRAREALYIDAPVSGQLAAAIPDIQTAVSKWWPDTFGPVAVHVESVSEAQPAAPTSGAFFSLGVDSFYTALNAPGCKSLIYMRGIEVLLDSSSRSDPVEARIRRVAAEMGKDLIIGRTNLRDVFPLNWAEFYHGAGLASVGHALGLSEVFVSSTHAINHLLFWGSHPLLDPLWSSERTRIVHFGNISRAEKTLRLARNPIALANLRVCVVNKGGEENCGKCFKCIRTMVVLSALDVLKNAPFPDTGAPLDLPVSDSADIAFAEELVDLLQRLGNPRPDLAAMVRRNLNSARRTEAVRDWVRAAPWLRTLIRRLRGIDVPNPMIQPLEPVPPVTIRDRVVSPIVGGHG